MYRNIQKRVNLLFVVAVLLVSSVISASAMAAGGTNPDTSVLWQSQSNWGIERVSAHTTNGAGNGSSLSGVMSGDGRYTVFGSRATNLVNAVDENGTSQDVMFHDRTTGQNEFVSLRPDGQQATGDSWPSAISDDGRYVLFGNQSDRILSGSSSTNPDETQVYLRDRTLGTTELLTTVNGVPGNGYSIAGGMSADQRYVVFYTNADNLIPGGLGAEMYDVVLLDRSTHQLKLVNVRSDGQKFGAYSSVGSDSAHAISTDGRFVLFTTPGDDPGNGDTNGSEDVYLRDLTMNTTKWVSATVPTNYAGCNAGSITSDGRFAVYRCTNQLTGANHVFRTDITTDTSVIASIAENGSLADDSYFPAISDNGRYVSFNWNGFSPLAHAQQAIRDMQTGHTALLTQSSGGTSSGNHYGAMSSAISADGKWVVFDSNATNLMTPDGAGVHHVYIRPLPFGAVADTTAPTLDIPLWSSNPKAVTQTSVLSVVAHDNVGIVSGEYFIGDTDPGQGNGATMAWNGTKLSASFGTNFQPGVYKITIRAKDGAGNWSLLTSEYLVVYDPLAPGFTGNKNIVPSLLADDMLPGLTSDTQTDEAQFGFTVEYSPQGVISDNSDMIFDYMTGTKCNNKNQAMNCHSIVVDATRIEWLIVGGTNQSEGTFKGQATVVVDGVTTSNPFKVTALDGGKLNPTKADTFMLSVYAPNADVNTASPLYRASGILSKGKITRK